MGLQAKDREPEILLLKQNGWMPNNPRLPVLLYRDAIEAKDAAVFEKRFGSNDWPAQWRNGIYDFHHYHSTAHEVLGIVSGNARIVLGGENGRELTIRAGDVAVLPAGTGHCKLEASQDFLVVGAYPTGQHWDICRKAPTPEEQVRMKNVPFPPSDPVHGKGGALTRHWI